MSYPALLAAYPGAGDLSSEPARNALGLYLVREEPPAAGQSLPLVMRPTVAGLDARIEYVPEHIRKAAFAQYGVGLKGACEAIWQFNVGLIDALCDMTNIVNAAPEGETEKGATEDEQPA